MRKPINIEIVSKADASRLEMCTYSGWLSCCNNAGVEDRMSISNRLTKRYPNGVSSPRSSVNSRLGTSFG